MELVDDTKIRDLQIPTMVDILTDLGHMANYIHSNKVYFNRAKCEIMCLETKIIGHA